MYVHINLENHIHVTCMCYKIAFNCLGDELLLTIIKSSQETFFIELFRRTISRCILSPRIFLNFVFFQKKVPVGGGR
jgi:hypothetical protein